MAWPSLLTELDHWARTERVATFWWRDDDATTWTVELQRLLDCAGDTPLALAVIPDLLESSLVEKIKGITSVEVLQHGWRHVNHAKGGAQSEYPPGRDLGDISAEFSNGFHKLQRTFGAQHVPVFAPPWHGFDSSYLGLLRASGIRALSRKGVRTHPMHSGVFISNIHCVPIVWTNPPSFGADDDYISVIVDHLEGRRCGRYSDEPTGVLTHHLAQNSRSYEFMSNLVAVISQHPAGRWLSARSVFPR